MTSSSKEEEEVSLELTENNALFHLQKYIIWKWKISLIDINIKLTQFNALAWICLCRRKIGYVFFRVFSSFLIWRYWIVWYLLYQQRYNNNGTTMGLLLYCCRQNWKRKTAIEITLLRIEELYYGLISINICRCNLYNLNTSDL